ncbi:MAG: hypothetical protein SF052_05015 [Bacteroidia bacterium]|nr:hypothetical protein [Bacteroidia bacterium]
MHPLYVYIRKGLSNFVKTGFTWLILLVFSPLLVVSFLGLGVIALLFYRKLKKTLALLKAETDILAENHNRLKAQLLQGKRFSELEPAFDFQSYHLIKKRQEQGIEVEKKFKELDKIKPEGEPPALLKPFVAFMQVFREYHQKQSEFLELLESETPRGKWFENVSENALWNNRNKAYEYLI